VGEMKKTITFVEDLSITVSRIEFNPRASGFNKIIYIYRKRILIIK